MEMTFDHLSHGIRLILHLPKERENLVIIIFELLYGFNQLIYVPIIDI